MFNEVLNQIVTVSVGLGGLGVSYLLWLLTGILNVGFTKGRSWSWKKTFEDLAKLMLLIAIVLGWVVVMNFIDWYAGNLGADISALMDGVSVGGMVAGILGGTIHYAIKVGKNFINFFNVDHLNVEITKFNEGAKAISEQAQEVIKDVVEYWAPPVEPEVPKKNTVTKTEAREAVEESQMGASVLLANVIEELKGYAAKQAFLKEDGSSGIYRGQCTQVPAYVYNKLGVFGAMGNGKDVVKNLIARGVAEPCGEEPGAIASSDNGTAWGHTWLALGNGYLIEQNVKLGNVKTSNFGAGTVYSMRVGKLSEFNRGKVTYCRLKGLQTALNAPTVPANSQVKQTAAKAEKPAQTGDTIEYTYKPGDTFGQVIVNLGLKTKHGLWGKNGDVAYYTKQLNEQGIYGNIPVGTTIKLTRRK